MQAKNLLDVITADSFVKWVSKILRNFKPF